MSSVVVKPKPTCRLPAVLRCPIFPAGAASRVPMMLTRLGPVGNAKGRPDMSLKQPPSVGDVDCFPEPPLVALPEAG